MHTPARDFRNNRSGNTNTSRRNSHRKTGAQGNRVSRMSADSEVIVSTQMGKGHYAFGLMQINTARKICRGDVALSGIDVLKKVFWVRTQK